MGSKITVNSDINYVYEGCQLLYVLAHEDKIKLSEMREIILERCHTESETVKNHFELLERILVSAREAFSEVDGIKNVFGEIENDIFPAKLVLCIDEMDVERMAEQSTEWINARYEKLSASEKDAWFLTHLVQDMEKEEFWELTGCEREGIFVPEAARVRHIFQYIQHMDISLENKMKIQEIYLEREQYFDRSMELLERAVQVLLSFRKELEYAGDLWRAYWERVIKEEDVQSIMEDVICIDWEQEKDPLVFSPAIIQCAAFFIYIDGGLVPGERHRHAFCRIGAALSKEFLSRKEEQKKYTCEEMQQALKVLGDKSKFDILLFIRDNPSYGSEIARHFNLTTATVSHHMNLLLSMQLVTVRQEDTRIYYQANKKTLQELLINCRKLFE